QQTSYDSVSSYQTLHTPEWAEFNQKPDSLFFNDGRRRLDFVLVYEEEKEKENSKKSLRRKKMRQAYESNLISSGLQLEATRSVLDGKCVFVKVHAPWELLCRYAEIMHIKLPLQPNDLKTHKSAFKWISKFFSVDENIIKPEQEFFTAPFENDRLSDFYIQDKDTFFNPATRSRIVHFILCRGVYAVRDNVKKFGINKLLDSGIYKAAFPLHDSRLSHPSQDPGCTNERYLLYREWAHPRNIFKCQPLDLVRKYYGEKIGIYFAWLGFYTRMLVLAAVVGLGCFLYGYFAKESCTWSQEVCDPNIGGKIIMCPQCDKECTYWNLTVTCESSKKLCIFDNFGTLVFAVFMGIWVTLFLEFWKRRQAELEYEWDAVEFLEEEEQVRPEYEARCDRVVVNEITKQEEHVPYTACGKCVRMTICTSAVMFWIVLIIASVIGIIVYRLSVFLVFSAKLPRHINGTEAIQKYLTPQAATSITASVISFIIIMILNMIYEKVAIMITDFGKAIYSFSQTEYILLLIYIPRWLKNLIGRCCSAAGSSRIVPCWEKDYHLQPVGKLGLFYEYLEMVIQFGFVTLFVASFPLAPILALINNLLEIRVDAWKITTQFRRMVPQKAQDIGAWQPIMQGIAILAVVTNAMIIAFTSDMIPRLVYYWSFSVPPYGNHKSFTMEGYINNTLSVFAVSDFRNKSNNCGNDCLNFFDCRYRDFRYPPGHEHQYERNIYYWHVIAAKLSFIIVMEHLIYFVKFIISYIIPDVSKETKSKIKREKYLTQKLLHENPLKAVKKNMGHIADKLLKSTDSSFRPKYE
uniref:Anoctamin n=1 Tax=Salvator merianae TaxID=96440 RepID=A0A8D0CD79_SALMN